MSERSTGNKRREKALATRMKVIRAAHAEFIERGFQGTTMAAVAKRAGVAVQTVYFVFHTKPELISAAIDAAVLGDEPVDPMETEWWRDMAGQPGPASAIRAFLRGAAPIFARASQLAFVLRAASLGDDEVRETNARHDALQRQSFRAAVEAFAGLGPLRRGLTIDTATDVMLTALSDAAYVQLTRDHGWSHEQVIDWWCETLPLLLVDDPSAG